MMNRGYEIVRWTQADDDKLRRAAGEQCTLSRVAAAFPAISIYAVKRRMKKLGIKPAAPAIPFSNNRTDPELVEQIRVLAANGRSAGAIEQLTGKTRNAVIGICHRYDIQLKGRSGGNTYTRAKKPVAPLSKLPPAPKVDKATKARANHNPWGFGRGDHGPPDAPRPKFKLPQMLPANPTKSIETIDTGECRYVNERPDVVTIETPIYCGRPAHQKPYCAEHRPPLFCRRG